jgi:hypothetical protein
VNRLGRSTRSADRWSSSHERARALAAERMDWPLEADDAAWLDRHLGECDACRALSIEYLDNRTRLRGLRDGVPPPPRDLWARTAAAIERESRRSPAGRGILGRVPLGAASGLLVVAVVLGATLLSNLPSQPSVTPEDGIADVPETFVVQSLAPAATPLAVGAGDVGFIRRDDDGRYALGHVRVDEVCPDGGTSGCATMQDAVATAVALRSEPQTIIGSPDDTSAVIVGAADGSNATEIVVMDLPKEDEQSPAPVDTPNPLTATPAVSPTLAPTPTATAGASDPVTESASPPPASPEITATPTSPATPEPTPPATTTPPSEPVATPTPTPGGTAIASDLIVVGQTAAFSADGSWFAFTARPADDSHGPDVYVWRVGDPAANPVTTDHRSVFASWDGGHIVGSRPIEDVTGLPDGAEVLAETFLLDPADDSATTLVDSGWRPIVDPDRDRALVFDGTLAVRDGGRQIEPLSGSLELRRWDSASGASGSGATVVLDDAGSTFDARWDEDGDAFAVWIEDPDDPSFGRLSLFFVDPATGALEQPKNAPNNEPALAGFSIGEGRLAWATPAGQGGEGSRVQIVAWTADGVGTAESAPAESVLVIR